MVDFAIENAQTLKKREIRRRSINADDTRAPKRRDNAVAPADGAEPTPGDMPAVSKRTQRKRKREEKNNSKVRAHHWSRLARWRPCNYTSLDRPFDDALAIPAETFTEQVSGAGLNEQPLVQMSVSGCWFVLQVSGRVESGTEAGTSEQADGAAAPSESPVPVQQSKRRKRELRAAARSGGKKGSPAAKSAAQVKSKAAPQQQAAKQQQVPQQAQREPADGAARKPLPKKQKKRAQADGEQHILSFLCIILPKCDCETTFLECFGQADRRLARCIYIRVP